MSIPIPYTFAAQSGNVPASELDADFSALATLAAPLLNPAFISNVTATGMISGVGLASSGEILGPSLLLDASGNFSIGQTTGNLNPIVNRVNSFFYPPGSGGCIARSTASNAWGLSSTGAIHTFYSDNGSSASPVGSIIVTLTATDYHTSSDYRLKSVSGKLYSSGAFLDALNPVYGTWNVDGSPFVGFIAHEVQSVSPSSVMGEKDAIDTSGAPVYQSVSYGSAEIIANIVAELKSLRARVMALEGHV